MSLFTKVYYRISWRQKDENEKMIETVSKGEIYIEMVEIVKVGMDVKDLAIQYERRVWEWREARRQNKVEGEKNQRREGDEKK